MSLTMACVSIMPLNGHAQGVIKRPVRHHQATVKPHREPASRSPRTTAKHLDLLALKDNKPCFFSVAEWKSLSIAQRSPYLVIGVVLKTSSQVFAVMMSDEDGGEKYGWYTAMHLYEDRIPTEKQGDIIAECIRPLNKQLKALGGQPMTDAYWTTEHDGNPQGDDARFICIELDSAWVFWTPSRNTMKVRGVVPLSTLGQLSALPASGMLHER